MNLLSIFQQRHSIRKYTGAPIDDAALTQIIQAGLLSASSRSIRPWEFIVVKDKDMLRHLSECRTGAAWMLAGADAAIVVSSSPMPKSLMYGLRTAPSPWQICI